MEKVILDNWVTITIVALFTLIVIIGIWKKDKVKATLKVLGILKMEVETSENDEKEQTEHKIEANTKGEIKGDKITPLKPLNVFG